MPRTLRASEGNVPYHVLNRGNGRAQVFHKPEDYAAFLETMIEASIRLPMRLVSYCLMPNHFHLVLRPFADGELSRWMHWLMTTHVRRYLRHYQHSGHVWQGRFKAFPIQDDEHLVTVVRYVERNGLKAGLVERAEDWPWSSLANSERGPRLDTDTIARKADWLELVNTPIAEAEAQAIRLSMTRDRPYGAEAWITETANRMGLTSSLRSPGRPIARKPEN